MKINSKDLWKYINDELGTYDKVKLNVYYDDVYVTQIYWNGENFEWEPGRFTSEAFFNPLYDFVEVEEENKIPEKLDVLVEIMSSDKIGVLTKEIGDIQRNFNQLIDYLKSKGE